MSQEKNTSIQIGFDLLGLVLSIRGGADLEALFAKRIFEPLKMNHTRIHLTDQQTNVATGHALFGKPVKHWSWQAPLGGAGALHSSGNDLLKFLEASLALTKSPLSYALQQTHVRQEKGGLLSPDVALGWHLGMKYKEKKFKWYHWHNGGTYGFHSYIAFDKEGRRGVVVLGNSSIDVTDHIGKDLITSKLFADKPPQVFPIAKVDLEMYDAYVGIYPFSEKNSLTITREEDRLFAQITGQSPLEVYPKTETEFFYKTVNAQLTFEKNKSGTTVSVILHQNGRDRRLIKNEE